MTTKFDMYQHVTDSIIDMIEKNQTLPWQKPWKAPKGRLSTNAGYYGFGPASYSTGNSYRGTNWMICSLVKDIMGYESDYWITFKQMRAKRGRFLDNPSDPEGKQRGTKIVFWKKLSRTAIDEDGEEKTNSFMMPMYFVVFNLSQTDLEDPAPKIEGGESEPVEDEGEEFNPIDAAQAIADGWEMAPTISHVKGDRAFYRVSADLITMPKRNQFPAAGEYYSTLFHEMGHATGHHSRLDRKEGMNNIIFGSHEYSKEELVAEFTAAYLCAASGIDNTRENSAAYLKSWVRKLKDEPKMLIQAAQQAQKAADMILGISTKEYK